MNNSGPGLLFDFNGVLVDDYALQQDAWSSISKDLRGIAVTDQEMVAYIRGIPTPTIVKWLAGNKILTQAELCNYVRKKDSQVQELFRNSPLVHLAAGLTVFLDSLRSRDVPMTIVSSSSLDNLQVIFHRFRLGQWFDIRTIIHQQSTFNGKPIQSKPKPDPYLAGAALLGMPPGKCIVFEDARSGIESATWAGVKTVVVVNTNPEHQQALSKLPGVITSIHDFTQIDVHFLETQIST